MNVAPCAAPALSARDRAAVQLDEVPHDREPEAEPAVHARGRAVGLPEALEDVRQELGRDALAGVARPTISTCEFTRRERDLHAAALRRELDRVRQQVPDDLLQPVGVAGDERRRAGRARLEADALGVGGGPHRLDRRLDHGRELDRLHVEPQLAGDDPRHVEQVLDELRLRRARCAR